MAETENAAANGALSDQEILQGFKQGDEKITKRYFYDYCRMAYTVCNRTYQLTSKDGMDFYSLAHEYYISQALRQWEPLERCPENVRLSTWLTNGFRFTVLDRLKEWEKWGHTSTFEERMEQNVSGFDVPDNKEFYTNLSQSIDIICDSYYPGDARAAAILHGMLVDGYKGKEVAEQLGISASAVSQRYQQMMANAVMPYFRHHFELDTSLPMPSTITPFERAERDVLRNMPRRKAQQYEDILHSAIAPEIPMEWERHRNELEASLPFFPEMDMDEADLSAEEFRLHYAEMLRNRRTPDLVPDLSDGQIFVFGSNLKGIHGGGASYTALRKFGAQMGQGVGLQGRSYAIPTMQGGVETIAPYVNEFVAFAQQHTQQQFLVTRIGCGTAGFSDGEIAPLFKPALEVPNICLPSSFWNIIG